MKQFWCLFLCLLGIIPVVAQQELYTQNPLVDHYVKQQLEQGKNSNDRGASQKATSFKFFFNRSR